MPNDIEIAFGVGKLSDEIPGKLDIDYLLDITSPSTAQQALDLLSDQANELELRRRHTADEMERMWRGVLRACIAHGVPLTPTQSSYAQSLGVVLPK